MYSELLSPIDEFKDILEGNKKQIYLVTDSFKVGDSIILIEYNETGRTLLTNVTHCEIIELNNETKQKLYIYSIEVISGENI